MITGRSFDIYAIQENIKHILNIEQFEKFCVNFEPYLAEISPVSYESLFNNKYDWGKKLFQPNKETTCALVDDQDLRKVIADTRAKTKVVISNIKST